MDKLLAIYQLNVQSADRIDERRDTTTRLHGGMCIFLTSVAVGTFEALPWVSFVLWLFLCTVAYGWLATLDSLKAKLRAKNELLTKMESDQDVPFPFLTKERRKWESYQTKPHQRALKHAPVVFLVLGIGGSVVMLAQFLISLPQCV